MANPHRGDVPLALGGKTYTLRPSMRFIAEAEARYGPLVGLIDRLSENRWTVAELVGVIELALDGADAPGPDALAEMVHGEGPLHCLQPVATLIANALTGGRVPELDTGPDGVAAEPGKPEEPSVAAAPAAGTA